MSSKKPLSKSLVIKTLQRQIDYIKRCQCTGFDWNDLSNEQQKNEIEKMECFKEAIRLIRK
jgi:hypothetical protein